MAQVYSSSETLEAPVARTAPGIAPRRSNSMLNALQVRDFRLLWIGQGTSLLGDQFYLIALPWLVLQLTNDPLALGFVLALAGIPRAVFMLVGGVITDRFQPRAVMLASDIARLVLVIALTALVITGSVQLWMLYGLALAFGLISGFFMPASITIVPQLIGREDLQGANAVFQGTAQLSMFLGPVLAGGVIALFAHSGAGGTPAPHGTDGIAIAFIFDALTFVVSVVTLWMMKHHAPPASAAATDVLAALRAGIAYVQSDPKLQYMMLIVAAINLLFAGPLVVGVPVMANTRLAEGVAAFGIIMSALGGGNLLGYVVAGALPKPQRMGLVVLGVIALFGVCFMAFAFVTSTPLAFLMFLIVGIGNGYISILCLTWMQQRTPREMLGRMMSLFLFANVGLVPLSQALSGALSKWSLEGLFLGAGALIVALAAVALLSPLARNMEM